MFGHTNGEQEAYRRGRRDAQLDQQTADVAARASSNLANRLSPLFRTQLGSPEEELRFHNNRVRGLQVLTVGVLVVPIALFLWSALVSGPSPKPVRAMGLVVGTRLVPDGSDPRRIAEFDVTYQVCGHTYSQQTIHQVLEVGVPVPVEFTNEFAGVIWRRYANFHPRDMQDARSASPDQGGAAACAQMPGIWLAP